MTKRQNPLSNMLFAAAILLVKVMTARSQQEKYPGIEVLGLSDESGIYHYPPEPMGPIPFTGDLIETLQPICRQIEGAEIMNRILNKDFEELDMRIRVRAMKRLCRRIKEMAKSNKLVLGGALATDQTRAIYNRFTDYVYDVLTRIFPSMQEIQNFLVKLLETFAPTTTTTTTNKTIALPPPPSPPPPPPPPPPPKDFSKLQIDLMNQIIMQMSASEALTLIFDHELSQERIADMRNSFIEEQIDVVNKMLRSMSKKEIVHLYRNGFTERQIETMNSILKGEIPDSVLVPQPDLGMSFSFNSGITDTLKELRDAVDEVIGAIDTDLVQPRLSKSLSTCT